MAVGRYSLRLARPGVPTFRRVRSTTSSRTNGDDLSRKERKKSRKEGKRKNPRNNLSRGREYKKQTIFKAIEIIISFRSVATDPKLPRNAFFAVMCTNIQARTERTREEEGRKARKATKDCKMEEEACEEK